MPRVNGPVTKPAFASSFSYKPVTPRAAPTCIPVVRDKVKFDLKKPSLQSDTSLGVKVFPSANRPNKDPTLLGKSTDSVDQKPGASSISHSDSIQKEQTSNPRIVLQIKNNQVLYNSVVDSKKPTNGSSSSSIASKGPTRLVPYNDEGSSDSDMDNVTESSSQIVLPPAPKADKAESPQKVNGNHSPKKKEKPTEPVLDEKLNTTLTVPGSYGPLDKDFSRMNLPKKLPGSPVKRSFSDSGFLNVNVSSNSKVNATSSWHVMEQDAMVSPSLASESSSASVNSTTDWHVFNKAEKRPQQIVPEAQNFGWKITPTKGEKLTNGESNHDSGEKKSAGELQIRLKRTTCSGSDSEKSADICNGDHHKDNIKTEPLLTVKKEEMHNESLNDSVTTSSCFPNLLSSKTFTTNGNGVDSDDHGKRKHKKKKRKKHKKEKKHDLEEETADSSESSSKKHKHKKKHKRHRKDDSSDDEK